MGYGCAALSVFRKAHLKRKMQFPWNHVMPLYNEQPILVNNAGIAQPRKLEEITETEWDEVLAVNLKSAFLATRTVIAGMRKRKWGRRPMNCPQRGRTSLPQSSSTARQEFFETSASQFG